MRETSSFKIFNSISISQILVEIENVNQDLNQKSFSTYSSTLGIIFWNLFRICVIESEFAVPLGYQDDMKERMMFLSFHSCIRLPSLHAGFQASITLERSPEYVSLIWIFKERIRSCTYLDGALSANIDVVL
jgi:hypothetical protein